MNLWTNLVLILLFKTLRFNYVFYSINRFSDWTQKIKEPKYALVIVDVQNDFIDGTLSLRTCEGKQDGVDAVAPINHLVQNGCFAKIIYSLDWHPEDHISFYENLHLRELHPDSKVYMYIRQSQ